MLEEKQFFFKKKAPRLGDQKTFVNLGNGLRRCQRPRSRVDEVFLLRGRRRLFLQKKKGFSYA
jgi:hypothetical protein